DPLSDTRIHSKNERPGRQRFERGPVDQAANPGNRVGARILMAALERRQNMSIRFSRFKSWPVFRAGAVTAALVAGVLLFRMAVPAHQSSSPESTTGQWMIEDMTGTNLFSLTMRYDDQSGGRFGWHSEHSFMTGLERLEGLNREQMMSAGAAVRFRIARDAGSFACEGWFKDGKGSGHFS